MTNEEYYTFIQPYADASEVLLARLNVLKHNLYGESAGQPIHNIQNRIKEKDSMEEKLRKKEKDPTVMNAKDYLQDIAGIRVICYFVEDIYNLAGALKRQTDLIVIRECDYIAQPKPRLPQLPCDRGGSGVLPGWDGIFPGGNPVPNHVHGFLGQPGAPGPIQNGTGRQGKGGGRAERICRELSND